MTKRQLSRIVLAVFVGLPLITLFQNCGGGAGAHLKANPKGGGLGFTERPYTVSGSLVSGGGVDALNFDFADQDRRVIFMADKDTDDLIELYAANRDGTDLIKLSSGGYVTSFKVRDNKIYFLEEAGSLAALYVADVAGGVPKQLSGAMVTGGQVHEYRITPDGNHVVFLADKDILGVKELFSVDMAAVPPAAPYKLHPNLSAGQSVNDFKALDPRVIFTGNITTMSRQQMYAIQYDGTNGHMITPATAPVGSKVGKFETNSEGNLIIYMGDMNTLGKVQLYRTQWDATNQIKLSPDTSAGDVEDFSYNLISSLVVLTGDLSTVGQTEIYAVDLGSGNLPVKLNQPMVTGGDVTRFVVFDQMLMVGGGVILLPAVAYIADADSDDRFELYYTRTFYAPLATRVNGNMNPAGDVFDFTVSADGLRVAYIADQDIDNRYELFTREFGSYDEAVKAAAGLGEQDVLPPLAFAPDNKRVLFAGDLEQAKQRQLYITAEGDTAKRITFASNTESSVYALKFSSDGRWLLFTGDQKRNGRDELYLAPVP